MWLAGIKIQLISSLLVFMIIVDGALKSKPCAQMKTENGTVCVCNETYCDTLDPADIKLTSDKEYVLLKTCNGGPFFHVERRPFEEITIWDWYFLLPKLNRDCCYQTMCGFGGTFTGSASDILKKMPSGTYKHAMEAFFSIFGLAWILIRLPLGGTDCDKKPWTYWSNASESPETAMSTLDERDKDKLDHISYINSSVNRTGLDELRYIGAAWTAPPWMKYNNNWTCGYLRDEFYEHWAKWHRCMLDMWHSVGIDYWLISLGNEPTNGYFNTVAFVCMGWFPWDQGNWTKNYLKPELNRSKFDVVRNVKIGVPDDQRQYTPLWASLMDLFAPHISDCIDYVMVHFYTDQLVPGVVLDLSNVFNEFKPIIASEACLGAVAWDVRGPRLGAWYRAEWYIKQYMQDFLHWVCGWVEWSFLLDCTGGPNYVQNLVDALVLVDETKNYTVFYKQPTFYVSGHFSRFVPRNSCRIDLSACEKLGLLVHSVGFRHPNNSIVIVLYNEAFVKMPYVLRVDDDRVIDLMLDPKCIYTLHFL